MFSKFIKLFFLATGFLLAFNACDEDPVNPADNTDENLFKRALYFPAGDGDGAGADNAGFFSYNINTENLNRIAVNPVDYTTLVAENGTIVFKYGGDIQNRFWGYCEGQNLVPVPKPQFTDTIFEYDETSNINLSGDGHHAAYFIRSYAESNPDELAMLMLIVETCVPPGGTTVIGDLGGFAKNQMAGLGVNYILPASTEAYPHSILLSHDGETIWVAVKGVESPGSMTSLGNMIIEYKGGSLRAVTGIIEGPINLLSVNTAQNYLVAMIAGKMYSVGISDGSAIEYTGLQFSAASNPLQYRSDGSRVAYWKRPASAIYLYSTVSENETEVISLETINGDYSKNYSLPTQDRISISPDGAYVVFALDNGEGSFDVFSVRSDGGGLKRHLENTATGIPVLSDD